MSEVTHALPQEPCARSAKKTITGLLYRIWRHRLTRGVLRRIIPRTARDYYRAYRQGNFFYDKTQVVLYADSAVLPWYVLRRSPTLIPDQERLQKSGRIESRISLIVTVLNQAASIQVWVDSICQQTHLPDEVLIADRGSIDGTRTKLQLFEGASPFPVRMVDAAGKCHSEAINLAIQNAVFPLIACTETTCTPDATWLENLTSPLISDPEMQLSAGFHQAQPGSNFQRLCAHILTPHPNYTNPGTFVPSWRSVAFRKDLWARVDGFPEWLDYASAEISFNYQAKQSQGLWAVVPDAVVKMIMPENLGDLYQSCYQEALADGITCNGSAGYWQKTLKLAAAFLLAGVACLVVVLSSLFIGPGGWFVFIGLLAIGLSFVLSLIFSLGRIYHFGIQHSTLFLLIRLTAGIARLGGFSAGVRERPAAYIRQIEHYQSQLLHILEQHPQRKGIIVYPPTHDWGFMFQLPQQMARQFARRGYLYFYATINEKTDGVIGFRQVDPNLFICHVPFETFRLCEQVSRDQPQPESGKPILYIGSPWNQKYLATFTDPEVIYDHYDDLAVSSGRLEDHQLLLQTADIILVTSQRLLDNVKSVRPDTIFAPNGVDYEHFQALCPAPNEAGPIDLQPILAKGKPLIGYTGALSERFDYDLYLHLAKTRPRYEFVLIGANVDGSLDRSGLLNASLENVSWLGMKSHEELPRYMWRFDAGIVPFKINEITLATTSIKVFEYMACGVPVVSVNMPESRRYPGVLIAETYEKFVKQVDTAIEKKKDSQYLALIDETARANTWENRADTLIAALSSLIHSHPL